MSSNTPQRDSRNGLLSAIHICKKQLCLSDLIYRDILRARYNKESAGDLTPVQLMDFSKHLKAEVNKQNKRNGKPKVGPDKQKQINKIEALLAEKGKAEGKFIPWSYAQGILEQQYQVKRFEWATSAQLSGVIAALYNDAVKNGRKVK